MIKIKITTPSHLPFDNPICISKYFPIEKLKSILYDFNIELVDDIENADFEIAGYNQLTTK